MINTKDPIRAQAPKTTTFGAMALLNHRMAKTPTSSAATLVFENVIKPAARGAVPAAAIANASLREPLYNHAAKDANTDEIEKMDSQN